MANRMAGKLSVKTPIWDQIMRYAKAQSKQAQESHVKVGILGADARRKSADGTLSMSELGLVHEYGTRDGRVPERSFIRRTFNQNRPELTKVCAEAAKRFIAGEDMERVLNKLGAWGAAKVKATITEGEGVPPPLKQATIDRKGSSRPLVDTGQLKNSITWVVWMGRARDAKGRFIKA